MVVALSVSLASQRFPVLRRFSLPTAAGKSAQAVATLENLQESLV